MNGLPEPDLNNPIRDRYRSKTSRPRSGRLYFFVHLCGCFDLLFIFFI